MNLHFEYVLYLDFGAPFQKYILETMIILEKKNLKRIFPRNFFFFLKTHDFLMKNKIPRWNLHGIRPQAHLSWAQA